MSTLPNINKLNKKQLEELHLQIEQKLYSFWDVVRELEKIKKEQSAVRNHFDTKEARAKASSKQIQSIEELGFTIIIYDTKRVGLVNYNMPQKSDAYYSANFNKDDNSITPDKRNPPSDEEIEKIKEILEITE